jgi:acid phosphatase type 7
VKPHREPRRWARALALVAGHCLVWLVGAAPAGAATDGDRTDVFHAVADARVEEAVPGANFGTSRRMGVDGDPGLRIESLLRFDLAGLTGQVQAATLRLYVVSDGTGDGPEVYPAGGDWGESGVTWQTRPEPAGAAVADVGEAAAGDWVELDVTPLVTANGTVSLLLGQSGTDGAVFYAREGAQPPELVVVSRDPVVMAAGDIACRPGASVTTTRCRHQSVADTLTRTPGLAHVLALGDLQYEDGLFSEFMGPGGYDATWGAVKAITRPVPGNHEYHTHEAAGYFDYFNGIGGQGGPAGERGKGYYSFDVGTWHVIGLNSEISTYAGSEQERWLRTDLATTTQPCVLAYWHAPRFSSGSHGPATWVHPLWSALHDARADIVLNGHDHDYERFARQDPQGNADPKGIRQFVVGTGGASHGSFEVVQPNSEVRDNTTFGSLQLTLRASRYEWEFVPEAEGGFTDSGADRCNDDPPAASLIVTPSTGDAPVTVTADASSSKDDDRTPIAGYKFDFGDGSPIVGPQRAAVATHIYEAPGTYTVTTTVTDTARQVATSTAQVVVNGNLVANDGFEAATWGWSAQPAGGGIVLDRVVGGHTGEVAARLQNGGVLAGGCALNDSPNWVSSTRAGTYTAKLWVRADIPGATLKLRLTDWSGTTLTGSARTAVTLTTEWQPVTVSYTAAAPGSSTLDFNAYVLGAPPGTCFYADDAVIELR